MNLDQVLLKMYGPEAYEAAEEAVGVEVLQKPPRSLNRQDADLILLALGAKGATWDVVADWEVYADAGNGSRSSVDEELLLPVGPVATAEPFPEELRFTDTDNAARFQHLHGERVRYAAAWKSFIIWDGTTWRHDPEGVLAQELAKDVSRRLFIELGELRITDENQDLRKAMTGWAKSSASASKIAAMVKLARGMPGILIDHDELDADPWALGVANGWIDLHTGTFHPPDPQKLMTMQAPVAFDPDSTAPRWRQALEEWLPDPELQDYFHRLCGEAVVGTVRDHLLVLIYGDGGNGKGTAIGTLAKVLGPYFVVPHKSLLISGGRDNHPTEKAALFRTRLAVAAETDSRSKFSEEQVKELTGGDELAARRLYENPWSFFPTHSLWLQTNHLPEVGGTDEGIWRRIRVMKWPSQFLGAHVDTALPEKLEQELPGVLNWMIDGALAWQRDGLMEPEAVRKASANYRKAEDLVERFLEAEGYAIGDAYAAPSKQLMADWAQWTETETGRRGAGQTLASRLQQMGCEKDSRRPPFWHGIGKTTETQGGQRY